MDRSARGKLGHRGLFPPVEPYARHRLPVGDGHLLHVEEVGNPRGPTVLVVHGGPGGGTAPAMRRLFDPRFWRVILFDQRGCGLSTPHASLDANTTWHLVADIERIRTHLGIRDWILFGGSWGATLSLLYAQAHPERVRRMVLRGVFLMMREELDWFYGGGAARFFPEEWERLLAPLPEPERDDVLRAYHRRLTGAPTAERIRLARAWARWENALAGMSTHVATGEMPDDHALAFARIETHYFVHGGWLERDDQILADIGRIAHIPATIVQGRYDMICPPLSAWRLARAWPAAELVMLPDAGHAVSEPPIAARLVAEMERLKARMG